ncbi:MAG: carboxypeptidase regulatory-like domain-containing protein [Pirellulaceae bacterium]|nr:carboxypeptidase regulatory-like domain-containing protein [Pirellulaceae bacterium]
MHPRYCRERLRRPIRFGWCVVQRCTLFVAIFAGAFLTAAQSQAPALTDGDQTQPGAQSDVPSQPFTLTLAGPGGNPLANTEVHWRIQPRPSEWGLIENGVKQGKLLHDERFGFVVESDDDGKITLDLPKPTSRMTFTVEVPGYGPYYGHWNPKQTGVALPPKFTAELESAWTVGGIVVDEQGKPVAGVEVDPSIKFRRRPGDTGSTGVGTRIFTDDRGQWQFEMVPDSKADVWVEVSHREFKPHRLALSRDKYALNEGQSPSAKVVLPRGLTIAGRVTDEAGKPIEGALVRTKFLNDKRSATTNVDGEYQINGCEDRRARVVVSAKGYAVDMAAVRVDAAMKPVDFELKPGGHVRIRVVDAEGKGLRKARIFFQSWRGGRYEYFEFDHVGQYTDENGVWEWDEAPLDEFEADICHPNGMQLSAQRIVARDEEYVFEPPGYLVVSGLVVDAETKQRIDRFQVVPGIQGSEGSHVNWVTDQALAGTGGSYRLNHLRHAYFAHFVRIDADGYLPQVSRAIESDEGNVNIYFKLKRGANVTSVVQTTEGKAIEGANVVLGVANTQISFDNGRVDNGSTYNAVQRTTDAAGRFDFPPQVAPYEIVIVHDHGYAHIRCKPGEALQPIVLTPWAQLTGTYRIGKTPMADISIDAGNETVHSYGDDTPNIFMHWDATTARDGSFQFDRIPEGHTYVRREIVRMVGDGAIEVASTPVVSVQSVAGEIADVQLGGDGVVVQGRLMPPPSITKDIDWKHASVRIEVVLPKLPERDIPDEVVDDPDKRRAWWEQWKETEAGKQWITEAKKRDELRRTNIWFDATVTREGQFRIDDVPEGDYLLSARIRDVDFGVRDYSFTVDADAAEGRELIDFGGIPLE